MTDWAKYVSPSPRHLPPACPKCGVGSMALLSHCAGACRLGEGEHLHRGCSECGYERREACADAQATQEQVDQATGRR